jgi:uncharacterized protein with beta-barrel porin domain
MKWDRCIKYIFCLLGVFLACRLSFAEPLPSAFDLRDINGHSYIGPVRDQGACGSCYSFGALAAAESVYNRHHDLYDTAAVDFSESFIIWSLSPLYEGFDGCNGASYDYEELTGLVEYGVPLEADFPYVQIDHGPDNHHWDAPRTDFNEWYRIPPNDIETTKRVIQSFGAVDAAVLVDAAFQGYPIGIFQNTDTAVNSDLPYYSWVNHEVSLVGWEDDPGDGGMGYWILRNSWGTTWGEDGYMRIRYTSAKASMEGSYILHESWGGEDVSWENTGAVQAVPWSAGGTTNAHAVDIWGGAGSSVTNTGTLSATAAADADLTTARGVYLWGGPQGSVANQGSIHSTASSLQNQAIAYGICAQAHEVQNTGQISASASASNDQALAYGVLLFNGGSEVDLQNNGQITAGAQGINARAYGVWTDSRSLSTVVNNGQILANASSTSAVGILLSGGPSSVTNTSRIEATADSGYALGVAAYADATIVNSGSILSSAPTSYSIYSPSSYNMRLILQTGSDLLGSVGLFGDDDYVELQGAGVEAEIFAGVETLTMSGVDWSLTGSSAFGSIDIQHGLLRINGAISGPATVEALGTMGGYGTLTGNVLNGGTVAPGNSIGTLTIAGGYTHAAGAVLETQVGDGASDLLAVTGAADIQGGTLQVVPYGYATAGDYTFLTAGTLQGAFDQTDTPAVLNAALSSPTPNVLSMSITRNTYQSLAADQDQSSVASVLDQVRPSAAGDMADILNQVDTMKLGGVQNSMDDLMPKLHGATSAMTLDNVHKYINHIRLRARNLRSHHNQEAGQTRIEGVRLASADDTMPIMGLMEVPQSNNKAGEASLTSNSGMWINTLGSYTKYKKTSESPAFREKMWSFMLGLEYRINDSLRGGVAGAVTQARLDETDSRSNSENDSYRGLLYALWDDAVQTGGYYAETALGFGQTRFDLERSIDFLNRTAFSKHDGQDYFIYMATGHDWIIDRWTFGPTMGIEYVYLHEEGYEEHGAGAADLKIDLRNSDSLLSLLGFHITRSFQLEKSVLIAELRARWDHDYLADSESLHCRLTAAGPSFDISGRDTAKDSVLLGASLKAAFSKNITGYLDYDCMLQNSDGYTSHMFNVGLKILF